MRLTEILGNAIVVTRKQKKQEDKNQKMLSQIIILMSGPIKLTVGRQKKSGEYIQYCITLPGVRMTNAANNLYDRFPVKPGMTVEGKTLSF